MARLALGFIQSSGPIAVAVSGGSSRIACQTKRLDVVLSVTKTTRSFTSLKAEKNPLFLGPHL